MLIDDKYLVKAQTDTDWICICPYCVERGLTADKKGKLYISKTKGVGHCFRCNFIYRNKYAKLENLNQELSEKPKVSQFDLSFYKSVSTEDPQFAYLTKRNIEIQTIIKFKLKSIFIQNKHGVIIPNSNITDNIFDYYQIRFLTGDVRYFNPKNSIKPLLGLQGIDGRKKLIICEGVFNCMSIWQNTDTFDSVAIQGTSLTDYQSNQLVDLYNDHQYDEIVIGLDKGAEGKAVDLFDKLKSLIPNVSYSLIFMPDTRDYNDYNSSELLSITDRRLPISVDNVRLVRGLFNL